MLRVASLFALVASLFGLAAYQSGGPKFRERSFPANSTVARQDRAELESPLAAVEADSTAGMHILMLNYTAYDSVYAAKVKRLITRQFPRAAVTEFWDGSVQALTNSLKDQHIVVVTYPAKGTPRQVRAYGKALLQFVEKGGAVLLSGTDQFGILQHLGLFDVDFGYFCSDLEIHEDALSHPVFNGTPVDFTLANYVYPLDVSDPAFVLLADVRGYPVVGYKPIGAGKVVYLGLEYYYDEAVSSRILQNTLRWLAPLENEEQEEVATTLDNDGWAARTVRRSEERLYVGSGRKGPSVDLKIYPNPYFEKATVDLELDAMAPVSVEMTDENGALVSTLLPYRTLNSGFYRMELPNVSSGVYFVKCQVGNQSVVRKIVKAAPQ